MANPFDVSNVDGVTPLDVLLVITYINTHLGQTALPPTPTELDPYCDVNDDGACTAVDVLMVIHYINTHLGGAAEGESVEIPELLSFLSPRLFETVAADAAADCRSPNDAALCPSGSQGRDSTGRSSQNTLHNEEYQVEETRSTVQQDARRHGHRQPIDGVVGPFLVERALWPLESILADIAPEIALANVSD